MSPSGAVTSAVLSGKGAARTYSADGIAIQPGETMWSGKRSRYWLRIRNVSEESKTFELGNIGLRPKNHSYRGRVSSPFTCVVYIDDDESYMETKVEFDKSKRFRTSRWAIAHDFIADEQAEHLELVDEVRRHRPGTVELAAGKSMEVSLYYNRNLEKGSLLDVPLPDGSTVTFEFE